MSATAILRQRRCINISSELERNRPFREARNQIRCAKSDYRPFGYVIYIKV